MLRVEARHELGDRARRGARGKARRVLALRRPRAGKTSVLRVAAGLLTPEQGRVDANGDTWLDTERGIDVPAEERRCGHVFQHYALFRT